MYFFALRTAFDSPSTIFAIVLATLRMALRTAFDHADSRFTPLSCLRVIHKSSCLYDLSDLSIADTPPVADPVVDVLSQLWCQPMKYPPEKIIGARWIQLDVVSVY